MGEAKRRGSFEERKIESIEKSRGKISERLKMMAERDAKKTPEQRRKERKAQAALANIVGMAAGMSMGQI